MPVQSRRRTLQPAMRRVTFGSVTVIRVPLYNTTYSLSNPESPLLSEPTLICSPPTEKENYFTTLDEMSVSHNEIMVNSPHSDSSLPLTQVALCSFMEKESDEISTVIEEEEERFVPSPSDSGTQAAFSSIQRISSMNNNNNNSSNSSSTFSCPSEATSSLFSLNLMPPPVRDDNDDDNNNSRDNKEGEWEEEILGETPLSWTPEDILNSLKRSNLDENDTTAAARSVRCRVEIEDAAPPNVCIFCHDSTGNIEFYSGYHLHLVCALWCPEVYYDKETSTLMNIDAVLDRCKLIKCVYCRQPGAPVGCVNEKCPRSYHLHCAIDAGAQLNEKTFELLCPKHSKKQS